MADENKKLPIAEETIDPSFPIIDAHHHMWDRPDDRYLVDELVKDIGNHNVIKTVSIEYSSAYKEPAEETEFVERITAGGKKGRHGIIQVSAGIVGFADLVLGDAVQPVLEAHLAAGKGRFRGIRYTAGWDPHPEIRSARPKPQGIIMDKKFREGFACLKKYNLSFDSVLHFHQLPELVDLAGKFPDTTVIVNHVGYPLRIGPYAQKQDEVMRQWKSNMAALAAFPNVYVKLGGLGMPRMGFCWDTRAVPPGSVELAAAFAPYFLRCIELFGVKRCMFESNFPPDKASYSYNTLWNAFKRFAASFSEDEKAALFRGTAAQVYRL
jgi:L-fuconolactonase